MLCSIFAFKHIVRNHKSVVWITNHATLLHSAMMMPPRQMLGIQHSIACAADAVAILGHYIPPFLQGIQITFNNQFQCSISSNLKSVVFKVQFQTSDLKFTFNSSLSKFRFTVHFQNSGFTVHLFKIQVLQFTFSKFRFYSSPFQNSDLNVHV